jgi:hypothetical protein
MLLLIELTDEELDELIEELIPTASHLIYSKMLQAL